VSTAVFTERFDAPPVCQREILRYAGCREADAETDALLASCLREVTPLLRYRVCFITLDASFHEENCTVGPMRFFSRSLSAHLAGCPQVLVFAATLGVEIDRLILRCGKISPAKALMLQAIGTERIEALCSAFCASREHALQRRLTPRFSPGYGDVPLALQKEILPLLDAGRQIGLTLNTSLLMSPTKSVTAFAGISAAEPSGERQTKIGCLSCTKENCAYRGTV